MNDRKQLIYGALACLAIAGAIAWILVQQREAAKPETRQHTALGEVLADLTSQQLAKREKKRVVAVSVQINDPALKAEEQAFLDRLKDVYPQAEIKEFYRVDPEGDKRYGPGIGLSARRFLRMLEHNVKADVIVSFIGAPDPGAKEFDGFTNKVPRFVAYTRDLTDVKKLLEKRWLRAAVVPRYQFPSPAPENPKTSREWFDRHFQIVTTNELKTLPVQ